MTFDDMLEQTLEILRRRGRVSYRALKLQFPLDDALLAALKDEIVEVLQLAVDQDGTMLVWTGGPATSPVSASPLPTPVAPQQAASTDAHAVPMSPADAERRQLTVLFCDLVDSTALAARLDPEELRDVVRAYQATCAEVIQRFDGHIAQYLGDGLLVYFGYPQAHEDDAQRAVRTGLGVVEALVSLNTGLERDRDIRLAVRVGIHTGLVVVGEVGGGGRQELLALGETPNVAARLQAMAVPDTVVISATTYRLLHGLFACRDIGGTTVKGIATPVHAYQVLRESGARSRLEVAASTGLTPLVGREQEMQLLLERWEQVKDGVGQVVVCNGETGIGKSRLLQEVKARLAEEPHTCLEGHCSPYYQHSPLYPVGDLLAGALGWHWDDAPDAKLRQLEEALAGYALPLPEAVPLLAALLSLPLPAHYPPLTLTPERQRQRTLQTLLALLLAMAAQHPVLLLLEDVHWVDPSTLEFLTLLFDQLPETRLFTLLAARPEFRPPWVPRAHLMYLTLNRCTPRQTESIVEHVAGGKALPAEVLRQGVDTPPLSQVLLGLWIFYHVRAEFRIALEQAEAFFTLARRQHDSALHLLAHLALGTDYFHVGELGRAQAHLDQAMALYDPQQHRASAVLYGLDLGVWSRAYTRPLWFLGYPDLALQRSDEAMRLAEEVQHPFSLAYALNWMATVHHLRREVQATYERAETVMALCTEQGFAL